jgi:hypothetical protein
MKIRRAYHLPKKWRALGEVGLSNLQGELLLLDLLLYFPPKGVQLSHDEVSLKGIETTCLLGVFCLFGGQDCL